MVAFIDSPLVNQWKDLRLMEDKGKVLNCSNTGDDNFTTRASLALAGRVLIDKPYWVSGLFAFLRQAWKVRKPFGIRKIGENLYVSNSSFWSIGIEYSKEDRGFLINNYFFYQRSKIILHPRKSNSCT